MFLADDPLRPPTLIPREWVPGNYIKSVKSDTYYDAANVKIDEVYYYVQDDLAAAEQRHDQTTPLGTHPTTMERIGQALAVKQNRAAGEEAPRGGS